MAVLAVVKKGAGTLLRRAADGAGNLVAKASSLSSAQLQAMEEAREKYLSEKPETDPEYIKRRLGSYAIEAYEAYLSELQTLYRPISLGEYADDTDSLNSRIRYFEVTKWVTDPTENNLDKLTNLYRVLSEEACNIALIYDRKRSGVKVYFAVVNNDERSFPGIANMLRDRLTAALRGNFPGVEIVTKGCPGYGTGIPEPLKDAAECSVAIVSNVPTEKSEKFISQSMEKLLDGIVPQTEDEEYTIVLLATPSQDALARKGQLGELYSELAPYASWSTAYTYTETSGQASSATTGINLGASVGRQTGLTQTFGTNSAHTNNASNTDAQTVNQGESDSSGTVNTNTDTVTDSHGGSHADASTRTTTNSSTNTESNTHTENLGRGGSSTDFTSESMSKSVNGGLSFGGADSFIHANVGGGLTKTDTMGRSETTSWSRAVSDAVTKSVSNAFSSSVGSTHTDTESFNKAVGKAVSEALSKTHSVSKGIADTVSKTTGVADTIGKMASTASNVGHSLGANIGANFARSSTVSVTVGKNETLTQQFTNFTVQDTLEVIKKQIKRLDQSAALGMWEFSAYFLSKSQTVANNAAHMYLSLTQGDESYLSQSAVNFWEYNNKTDYDIAQMLTFLRRLQHPEFVLDRMEENWLMYPPHVNATVSLTGRELSYALNLPKKSVSGLPVLESVAFGREVQRYSSLPEADESVYIGRIYHMRRVEEHIPVKLDLQSLCSHTFITGSTGTGKSNYIYNILNDIRSEYNRHFLVIEPAKGEYKNVFGGYPDVTVYGTNPMYTELLRINPFSFPPYISVLEHIDRLVEIFNACWPMYAAMPAVLKDAIEQIYRDKGWMFANPGYYSTDFPTFADLIRTLPEIMESSLYSTDTKSDYSGALITRVKSLTNGINGAIFCSDSEITGKDLFDKNVIVDISRVGSSETKSLIMGILIMKLQEYRMKPGVMDAELNHVTVIEEAHNLLRKTSYGQSQEGANLQGKSVEMLTNAIAEMRTYGEGFIIADQAPDMLDEAVIRNTNTKIVLRLPNEADCQLVGKAIALKDEQIHELAKLPAYVAAVYQNDWVEAVLCRSERFADARAYSYEPKDYNLPIRSYLTALFRLSEQMELNEEERSIVHNWIDRLDNGDYTKNLLRNGLNGTKLTQQQLQVVAYNLFNGQKLALLLRGAADNAHGLQQVEQEIRSSFRFEDQTVVDAIRQQICAALTTIDSCDDISRRYQFFAQGGGIL